MNLHVTNDNYGFFPVQIAKRLRESSFATNNIMVNISSVSHFRDQLISYIPDSSVAFKKYIGRLPHLDKIIFHPYNLSSFHFLSFILKRFPHVKVYWVCWSYELYKQPQFVDQLYGTFSASFVQNDFSSKDKLRNIMKKAVFASLHATGLKKNYFTGLTASYERIDYFCSFLPSDFHFFESISPKKNVQYLAFSYLSLDNIMPDMESFNVCGNDIMIGHSALPDGNHYEIIHKLAAIDAEFPVFLPLAYGNSNYKLLIRKEALSLFKNVEIQEEKLESVDYYRRLTKVGWAIINSKVQQGLGNILALIWIGTKLFLDENASTYRDFKDWGIVIFNVQHDLTREQLSTKLSLAEIENNRRIIRERFNEKTVSQYWEPLLN